MFGEFDVIPATSDRVGVLCVSDQLDRATQIGLSLEDARTTFTVRTADRDRALGILDRELDSVDCVVDTDFEPNGRDFVRAVRDVAPTLPLVCVFGTADTDGEREVLSAGISDVLVRRDDTDGDFLAHRIESLVARVRAERELERMRGSDDCLLDASPVPAALVDETRAVTYCNDATVDLFGAERSADIVGHAVSRFVHPEDRARVANRLAAVFEAEVPTTTERLRTVVSDGTTRRVVLAMTPIDRSGPPVVQVAFYDVTPFEEAKQALRQQQQLVENALHALDDVFYVFDTSGRLVQWNQELNDVFGLTDDELAGMSPTEFFVEADQPAVFEAVERTFEAGEAVVEARAPTADGTVVVFELTGRRLTDEDGDVIGLCGIGRDVTEQRTHERKLARQNAQLEQFARVVSHDVRNPLGVAKGYLELEREGHDSSNLSKVATALDRIDHIVDDVLLASRQGGVAESTAAVSLETVARRAWESVETDGAIFRTRTRAVVEADPDRLQRLLENLFRNSVEHGSLGSRTVSDDSVEHGSTSDQTPADESIHITIGDLDDGFYVEDDGCGIALDDRERAYDAGYTTSTTGTGFGLAIVRELAAAHGWQTSIVDGSDGGARLEFGNVTIVRRA